MFARRAIYRQVAQHKTPTLAEGIWISDELLNNVLHRFIGVSISCRKRYGSSVPGPMEARRRLARRRIANVTVSGASIPTDYASIFGLGEIAGRQEEWKWEAPALPSNGLNPEKLEQEPSLPFWLTDYAPSGDRFIARPRKAVPRGLGSTAVSKNARPTDNTLLQFKKSLSPEMKIKDLRRVICQIDFTERQNPAYSGAACEVFFAMPRNLQEIEEFYIDPELNHPAACNLIRAILSLHLKGSDSHTLAFLLRIFNQALARGSVSEREIRALWREIPTLTQSTPAELTEIYQSLWESIHTCPVLPPRSLSPQTLDSMLVQLSKISSCGLASSLAKCIICSASTEQQKGMKMGISSFLGAWVKSFTTDTQSALSELSDFLLSSPYCLSESVIVATTKALSPNLDGQARHTNPAAPLLSWLATLQYISTRHDSFNLDHWALLGKALDIEDLEALPFLSTSADPREICRFLLYYWKKSDPWKSSKSTPRILDEFAKLPSSINPKEAKLVYYHLISILDKYEKLTINALRDIFRIFRILEKPDTLLQIVQLLSENEIPVDPMVISAEIQYWCTSYPQIALELFHLHWGLQLEGCEDLAIALVNLPFFPAMEIFKLLDRNLSVQENPEPLSSSSSSSSSSSQSFSTPSTPPFIAYVFTPHDPEHLSNPRPLVFRHQIIAQSRISLFHSLATAFAYAPHITSRMALRNIIRCYTYLERHATAIEPEMSRALAHAGITRALQEGKLVGVDKLRWILAKVSQVEGQEVADQLDRAVWIWRGKFIWERRRAWLRREGRNTDEEEEECLPEDDPLWEDDFPWEDDEPEIMDD